MIQRMHEVRESDLTVGPQSHRSCLFKDPLTTGPRESLPKNGGDEEPAALCSCVSTYAGWIFPRSRTPYSAMLHSAPRGCSPYIPPRNDSPPSVSRTLDILLLLVEKISLTII